MSEPTTLESFGEKPPIFTTVEDYQREMKDLANARARLDVLEKELASAQKELSEAEREFLRARDEYETKWRRLRQVTRNMRYWQTRIATLTIRYEGLRVIGWRYLKGTQRPEYQRLRGLLPAAHARLLYWTDEQTTIINEINAERTGFTYLRDAVLGATATLRELRAEYNSVKTNIATLEDTISRKVIEEWLGDEACSGADIYWNALTKQYIVRKPRTRNQLIGELVRREKKLGVTYTACYDQETDFLTEDGWKDCKDVSTNDRIATRNRDGQVEFEQPVKTFKTYYEGLMYCAKSRFLDLLVTPNHDLFIATRQHSSKLGPYRLVEAQLASLYTMKRFSKVFEYEGQEQEFFVLPRMGYLPPLKLRMDDWLELFGYWLAEGSLRKPNKKGGGGHCVCLTQKEGELKQKMIHCIRRLGFTPFVPGDYNILFASKQVYMFLKPLGHASEKYVPKEFKQVSKRQLQILINAMIAGDGWPHRNRKTRYYRTVSSRLRDDLQEIAVKNGFNCSYREVPKPKSVPIIRGKMIQSRRILWELSLGNDRQRPRIYPSQKIGSEGWIPYKGFVYCVEVPNHVLFVRRNGKCVWCGNSIETSQGHDQPLTVEITTVTLVREKDSAAIAEVEKQLDRKTMDYMIQNAWGNLMPSFEKKGIEYNSEGHIKNIHLYPFTCPDYPIAHVSIERKSRYIAKRSYESDISLI